MSDIKYDGPTQLVHLHTHTLYSFLDGVSSSEQLFATCKERDWPALAITEHGHMASVPDNYFAAKENKIKYIPGCFLADQPVYGEMGVKPISAIKPGEMVLSGSNRFRNVNNLQIRDYNGEMIRISAWGVEDIICTPEHPLLVRRVERCETARGVWQESISVEFFKAGDLRRQKYHRTYSSKRSQDRSSKRRYGYYLCVKRLDGPGIAGIDIGPFIARDGTLQIVDGVITSLTYSRDGYRTTKAVGLPLRLPLDSELLWICGLWLAEGSLKSNESLEFTLCSDELPFAERIRDYFDRFGLSTRISIREDRHVIDVSVNSGYFSRIFDGLFGHGFDKKRISNDWLFGLSREQASMLLEGLLDGDAKRTDRTSYLKLCNETLVWQARFLLTAIGQYSAITPIPNNNSDNIGYTIRKRESGHCYYDWDDTYVYLPIYNIDSESHNGQVYNIEVDEDNTYNIGVIVHNCEIYFNDYEPKRQELAARGISIPSLKQTDPELHTRIMRNRHLTIIAANQVGVTNLIKLTTQAHETGFYYRPRIWLDKLLEYREGLIVLSGCLNGPIAHELRLKNIARAEEYIKKFIDGFGKDNFFIELQMPCLPELGDDLAFAMLNKLANKYGLGKVLANDAHYLDRKDFQVQKCMMAIDQQLRVDDPNLFHVNSDEQFFKTRAQLWETFKTNRYSKYVTDKEFHDMCDGTIIVAEKCSNYEPDISPKPPKLPGAKEELTRLVIASLKDKGLDKCTEKYVVDNREVTYMDQVKIELGRFFDKNFESYFLVTRDLVKYSMDNGWPVGPRGSVGGSLVCFLLGITSIDPLVWGLSFDRFLSPSRGGYMLNLKLE